MASDPGRDLRTLQWSLVTLILMSAGVLACGLPLLVSEKWTAGILLGLGWVSLACGLWARTVLQKRMSMGGPGWAVPGYTFVVAGGLLTVVVAVRWFFGE